MAIQVPLNPNARLEPNKPYVKPRVKDDRAAYVVTGNGFFDHKDKFRYPGSMFYYDFEPSLDLTPLNKLASEKKNAFLAKLNELGNEMAKKNKKNFTPYEIVEWSDGQEELDLPQVEYLMGIPKQSDIKDEIR